MTHVLVWGWQVTAGRWGHVHVGGHVWWGGGGVIAHGGRSGVVTGLRGGGWAIVVGGGRGSEVGGEWGLSNWGLSWGRSVVLLRDWLGVHLLILDGYGDEVAGASHDRDGVVTLHTLGGGTWSRLGGRHAGGSHAEVRGSNTHVGWGHTHIDGGYTHAGWSHTHVGWGYTHGRGLCVHACGWRPHGLCHWCGPGGWQVHVWVVHVWGHAHSRL